MSLGSGRVSLAFQGSCSYRTDGPVVLRCLVPVDQIYNLILLVIKSEPHNHTGGIFLTSHRTSTSHQWRIEYFNELSLARCH